MTGSSGACGGKGRPSVAGQTRPLGSCRTCREADRQQIPVAALATLTVILLFGSPQEPSSLSRLSGHLAWVRETSSSMGSNMFFFGHLGEIIDPEQFFREQEYIVCRGALDDQAISSVVDLYRTHIIPSKRKYFRQSSRWERNQMTPYGGVSNCLLQPHSYERGSNGRVSDQILKLLSTPAVRQTLSVISGKSVDFTLNQPMFFDHSTTEPHQDWIFLDSRPNGHLIAAWIALQDILPEGIRFYVYPGSHRFKPSATYNPDAADMYGFYKNFLCE